MSRDTPVTHVPRHNTSFCRQVPPEECRIVLRQPQRIVRLVLELVGLDGLCEPDSRGGGLATIHPLHPPG